MINNIAKDILLNTQFLESKWQIEKGTKEKSDKKSIGFRLPDGREFALDRTNANEIKIWIEDIGAQPPKTFRSEFKEPAAGRNSSLRTTAPKTGGPNGRGLGGNPAYAIFLKNEGELREFLRWYSSSSSPLASSTPPLEARLNITVPESPAPTEDNDSVRLIDANELSGTGYEPDPKIRRVVELHAVAKASAFYKTSGYLVTEKGKPYDLLCEKSGEVIHVEVKGSRNALEAIIVTTNEVGDARNANWRSDLFLVDSIVLKLNDDGVYEASGGRCRHANNWVPVEENLTPTQYRYKLPPIPDAE